MPYYSLVMAFNQPHNIPSFNTDRADEDNYWRQKYTDGDPGSSKQSSSYAYPHTRSSANGHAKKPSMSTDQIKEKIGDFLGTGSNRDLPLYKDKPRYPSRQRSVFRPLQLRSKWRRWALLALTLIFVWWFSSSAISWLGKTEVNWATRQSMVRHAFVTSWEDYAKSAWGQDVYSPITHRGRLLDDKNSAGAGWIIVDALDSAIIMNCSKQVAQAREWIHTSLDFGRLNGEMNTFETTIRILGGLLSAHYLSRTFPHLASQRDDDWGQKGEDLYIEKAVDLADRLLGAFDSPSGIPYSSINLNSSHGIASDGTGGASSVAEAGTLQLEFKYVTYLTGEPLYWNIAEKVMEAIDAPRVQDGLVPIFINPQTGSFEGDNIRLGSRGDSYYEYLVKQYLQTGEKIYKEMWDEALEGIKRHMITWSTTSDFTILAERPSGLKGEWSGKMDHLTCFLPGTIALGVTGGHTVTEAKRRMGDAWGQKQEEDLVLAEELMKTCLGMYAFTPTGLAAEITVLAMDDPPRRWNFDAAWKQPRSKVDFEDVKSNAFAKNAAWRKDYEIRAADVHNLQRPETVESLYNLWRITGKGMYREWGWRIFQAFSEHAKVVNSMGGISGYTSLESVLKIPPQHLDNVVAGSNMATHFANMNKGSFKHDNMEGFWLSETLKYLFLLFTDDTTDDFFDLSKVVMNTEAHFFPRFDITASDHYKTGWVRKAGPTTP